ncbi:MAG: SDR family NAD(P)-dependent oxidoreductase [Actinomycetota bacterium]
MNWNQAVVVITGASSGIGQAAARAFAERGATIIAVARREERLAALVAELGGAPHSYAVCDVSDIDQIRRLAGTVAERAGRVDVLFTNAGIPSGGSIAGSSPEEVEQVIRTNLIGPIWCIQEFLPLLAKGAAQRPGSAWVLNMASVAGRIPLPGSSVYTATKFGMVGFTEAVWGELRDKGINSLVVEPGFCDTEGFPMDGLLGNPLTRGLVMHPPRVAEAIYAGIERGSTEVRVQWFWHPIYFSTILLGPLRRRVSRRLWQAFGRDVNA